VPAVYPRRRVPAPTKPNPKVYRIASWASGALAFAAAVLTFAFGLAFILGPSPAGDGSSPGGTRPGTTQPVGEVLATDQWVITGTLSKLVGTKVSEAPRLPLPLTLTVARGGGTKAEFAGGAVAGKNATIAWDGGRPLPISGEGSVDLNGPINVELDAQGATWALDGDSRLLTPGTYNLNAGVAVIPLNTTFGVARERATLSIPQGAAASLKTNGDVRTVTKPAPLLLKGPGQLVLEGSFEVRGRDGVKPATKLTFGPGAFELDIAPDAGGYRINQAFLQGPTTIDA
jgi:hypothetical protein